MPKYPAFKLNFPREQWTLPYVLRHRAGERGDRPFLRWEGRGHYFTYDEVNRIANRLAHGFAKLGVKKGDRVVLFLPNSLDMVFMWFALNKLGAVEAPVNDAYKGAFLEHQFNISDSRILIADEALLDRVAESEANMPGLSHVIVWSRDGAYAGRPYRLGRATTSTFAELDSGDEGEPDVEVATRDPGAILFTSGTTGPSKGVIMSHAHLYFFAESYNQLVDLGEADTCMSAYPLFHGNAQFTATYPAMIVGGRCVLYERFSAGDWVDRLYQSEATVTNFLGATTVFVHNQPPSPRDRGHKLSRVFAVPTPHTIEEPFKQRFGIDYMVEGFGQTEISLCVMQPRGVTKPEGACGVLLEDWYEARIVDPVTDEELPDGQVGEFVLRHKVPDIILSGYVGMPQKTLETWRNLWFHSGDALMRDKDGWYYFRDRIKDALRRRGENISSFEVEAPIQAHPAVAAAAVIAVKAEFEAGEDEVKACVVLRPGAPLDPVELARWCDARMPYFLVPRYFEFMDELPVTVNGKIQKEKLRAAGNTAATWDRIAAGHELAEEKRRREKREQRHGGA